MLRVALLPVSLLLVAAPNAAASVDYGPISHSGLRAAGAASGGLKLSLQLGLVADQQGIANAAKSASNPGASSYGSYPSLSTLTSRYGASSTRRSAVVNAFKPYGITATVDVTHLRVSARLDLWVHPISEEDDDGDVEGFLSLLAQPLQATAKGTPLPDVISVSYGVCEAQVAPYTASRTLVERQLTATAALGITTVVAAGDSGSSACAHGVPPAQLTSADQKQSASWPATSPWVLAVGGTDLALTPANAIASSGVWNDTADAPPYEATAGGGGGVSTFVDRPWWQPATATQKSRRMVPDVAAFADASPGYVIVCSPGVQGCGPGAGQTLAFVGGTSASAPLVAGMIALWTQQARQAGKPRPGFVAPLLYSLARRPGMFLDIVAGDNVVFGGVSCCSAAAGFDLASGLGSPLADQIATQFQ